MSLEKITEEEWAKGAEAHDMSVEDFKKAVAAQAEQDAQGGGCGCGGGDHDHGHGHQHHKPEIRKFEDFSEDELIEGAKVNEMPLEEFKEALKAHLLELEAQEANIKDSIEDFTEEELISGAKENNMELEVFKAELIKYLENQKSGGGCCGGGHGDEDHECCGGDEDKECCSSDSEKESGCGCH